MLRNVLKNASQWIKTMLRNGLKMLHDVLKNASRWIKKCFAMELKNASRWIKKLRNEIIYKMTSRNFKSIKISSVLMRKQNLSPVGLWKLVIPNAWKD